MRNLEESVLASLSRVYPLTIPVFKNGSTKHTISFILVALVLLPCTHGYSLRKRRGVCEYGEYLHEGKTCCLCPRGHHVYSHCKINNTQPVCEICETGKTYTEEANSHESCDQCTVCRPQANLEEVQPCTPTSNAVCKCIKGYFCEGPDSCIACQPCGTCEWGEKEPCTASKNVVCKEAEGSNTGVIVAVIIALLVVAAAGGVFVLRKKKLLCFRNQEQEPDPSVEVPLRGVDLGQYMNVIVEKLSWSEMAKVAYSAGMNQVQVDRCKNDHPYNEEEQTRSLLNAWIQQEGLESSETFIQALRKCHLNQKADIIKRHMIEGRK